MNTPPRRPCRPGASRLCAGTQRRVLPRRGLSEVTAATVKWYVTPALAEKHLVEPARIFEVDTEALGKLGTRERAFLDEVSQSRGPGVARSASTSAAGTRREVEGAPAYGLPARAPHHPVCCRSRGARGHHAQPGAADSFGTSVRGCPAQGGGDAADMRMHGRLGKRRRRCSASVAHLLHGPGAKPRPASVRAKGTYQHRIWCGFWRIHLPLRGWPRTPSPLGCRGYFLREITGLRLQSRW